VWGVGCGVVGPGFRDPGFGCRFAGFGCWVWHPGLALLALHSKGAPSSRGRCRLAIRARCSGFSFRIPPLSQVQATGHRLVPGFGFRGSGSKWVNALIIVPRPRIFLPETGKSSRDTGPCGLGFPQRIYFPLLFLNPVPCRFTDLAKKTKTPHP